MCSVLDDESIAVRGEKGENKLAHGDRRIYRGRSQRKYAKGYPSTRSFTDAEVSGTGKRTKELFPANVPPLAVLTCRQISRLRNQIGKHTAERLQI